MFYNGLKLAFYVYQSIFSDNILLFNLGLLLGLLLPGTVLGVLIMLIWEHQEMKMLERIDNAQNKEFMEIIS